jgi:hypothetical protein
VTALERRRNCRRRRATLLLSDHDAQLIDPAGDAGPFRRRAGGDPLSPSGRLPKPARRRPAPRGSRGAVRLHDVEARGAPAEARFPRKAGARPRPRSDPLCRQRREGARVGNCPAVWRTQLRVGGSGTLPDASRCRRLRGCGRAPGHCSCSLEAAVNRASAQTPVASVHEPVEWGGGSSTCGVADAIAELLELVLWDRLFDEREDLVFLEPDVVREACPELV